MEPAAKKRKTAHPAPVVQPPAHNPWFPGPASTSAPTNYNAYAGWYPQYPQVTYGEVAPLSAEQEEALLEYLTQERDVSPYFSFEDTRLLRKLKLSDYKRRHSLPPPHLLHYVAPTGMLEAEPPPVKDTPCDPAVLDALTAMGCTPFAQSFACRVNRCAPTLSRTFIHRDWESRAPWMDLVDEIYLHFCLSHPSREIPVHTVAPIDYDQLRAEHLPQVHELLWRAFWPGVNVSDCLDNSPEQCTVVATYKRLVVGVALLSGPSEGYLIYLAVRAGWDGAGIATFMLHHLIKSNPNIDITLHVSATNSAMLLYNRFGFKAEEFVVGFYDKYLPRNSRGCKNAFFLRLRA